MKRVVNLRLDESIILTLNQLADELDATNHYGYTNIN